VKAVSGTDYVTALLQRWAMCVKTKRATEKERERERDRETLPCKRLGLESQSALGQVCGQK